jgi:hypothetical protein
MLFDNNNIETLLNESKSFSLEGFNIFAIGKDDLPHIVCTAPNKSIARALHVLLETAKKAHGLPGILGYVTGDAALIPQVLANGHIALTATLILNDDTICKDGIEVAIGGEFIESGTTGYDEFVEKLRQA